MAEQGQESLGRATLTLDTDDAKFNQGVDQAEGKARGLEMTFKGTAKAIAVAAVAAAAAIGVLVKSQIDQADAMYKAGQAAGLGTLKMSEYAYSARLSDLSAEQLSQSLGKLSRNILDTAAGTGEAREAFDALGIKVKNAGGTLKSQEQILGDVADRFAGMKDGLEKTALSMLIFGRAGRDMIPWLNQGSSGIAELRKESHAFGVALDSHTGAAAERFNDNLTRLNAIKQGIANNVVRLVLPALNSLSDGMVGTAKSTDLVNESAQTLATMFKGMVTVAVAGGAAFKVLGDKIGSTAASMLAFARGDFRQAWQIQMDSAQDAVDTVRSAVSAIQGIWSDAMPSAKHAPADFGAWADGMAAPMLKNREAIKQALEAQIADLHGFADRYGAAIGLATALAGEAHNQQRIDQEQLLRQTAANEEARLQVLQQAFSREAELYRQAGEVAKAVQAQNRAAQLEAERMAAGAIAEARITSLRAMWQRESDEAELRWRQDLLRKVERISLENLTEQELATLHFEQKKAALEAAVEQQIITAEAAQRKLEELELRHQAKRGNIDAQGILARRAFEEKNLVQQAGQIFGQLANITAGVAQHNRTLFELNRVAGIANAIIYAYEGIGLTLKTYPYPWSIAMAAAQGIAAFAQVQAIRSQQFGSGGAAPSLAGSTPAPAVTPVTSGVPEPAVSASSSAAGGGQANRPSVQIFVEGRLSRAALEELAEGLNGLKGDGFPLFEVQAVG